MKLEEQVISLEVAKKLKGLGVKQESYFYWADPYLDGHEVFSLDVVVDWGYEEQLKDWINEHDGENRLKENSYSAFTVAELGEMLPDEIKGHLLVGTKGFLAYRDLKGWDLVEINEKTEANARGKMLIYILENKLIEATH